MQTHRLLDEHPSVQDLTIVNDRLNPVKATMHQRQIAANNFTFSDAVNWKARGAAPARGQTVVVVKNDVNLRQAAIANRKPPTPAVKAKHLEALPPIADVEEKKSQASSLAHSSCKHKRTTDHKHKTPSLVDSVASVNANSSRASSYSEYTCSCCNPRPTSTVSGSQASKSSQRSKSESCFSSSAYENMTSISERIEKEERKSKSHSSASQATSVNSTKLRRLEEALTHEREGRLQTQDELAKIRERQELLLSRLSETERAEFQAALNK